MWGDMGRYGEIQGDMGRYGEHELAERERAALLALTLAPALAPALALAWKRESSASATEA